MKLRPHGQHRLGLAKLLFGISALALSANALADDLPTPTNLTAQVFGSDVHLSWDAYYTTNLPADCTHNQEIQIRRNGTEIATTGLIDISYSDLALGNGAYTYEVRARCRIPAVPSVSPAKNLTSPWSNSAIAVISTATCLEAPSVAASVAPALLWPPNGKMVAVTVTGTVTAGSGCQAPSQVVYELVDEYGELSSAGTAEVSGGAFSLPLSLEASRLGYDLDGRNYSIYFTASAENFTSEIEKVEVLVPHDQRRR